jgi:uncharacterized protein YxjI
MQYLIKDKTSPLTRELVVEDRSGHCVLRAHGPVVRLRDELQVDDAEGVEKVRIKEPVLGDRRTFELYQGKTHFANVSMVAVGNLLDGYDINVIGGQALHARGDMLGREFTMSGPKGIVARVRKHDSHSIECETAHGQDDTLLLAGILAMAAMTDAWARAATRHQ